MEELKGFIEELENNLKVPDTKVVEITYVVERLKEIYKILLRKDLRRILSDFIDATTDEDTLIKLHNRTAEYTYNYIAYPNDEDFYIDNCSGYIDAIERAMDSNNWSANDEYIDDDFETFDEYEFCEKIRDNSLSLADDIINTYIKNETYRNYIQNADYIYQHLKSKLEDYMNKVKEIN